MIIDNKFYKMKIEIKTLSAKEKIDEGISSWPIWSCNVSEFDWEYEEQEACYLLEGQVEIHSELETVALSAGDFVVFPQGFKCRWKVTRPVRKHYSFR